MIANVEKLHRPVGDTDADDDELESESVPSPQAPPRAASRWHRVVAFGLLPGLALILALAASYFKWLDWSARDAQLVGVEAVRLATGTTTAMLSYKPATVEDDLNKASERLTGTFKDSYTSLTHDIVIPGSKQRQISAAAKIVAAAPVSVDDHHAVVLLFVDQTTTIGTNPPTGTASAVRVTLDEIGGRWLISQFEPI